MSSFNDRVDDILKSMGIRIENRAPTQEILSRNAPESNARALGEVPPDESGHWYIDWENPNDPLRRAILGLGPKRPYGKG